MQPAKVNTNTKTSKREKGSDDLTAHMRHQPACLAAGSNDKRARNESGLSHQSYEMVVNKRP